MSDPLVQRLCRLIGASRMDLSNEKRLQEDLAEVLTRLAIPFEREKRLNGADIPDFLIDRRIVVECKLKGNSKMAVYGQLLRYAGHDCVETLILASNLSMGLPVEIGGKPAFFVGLGGAWL